MKTMKHGVLTPFLFCSLFSFTAPAFEGSSSIQQCAFKTQRAFIGEIPARPNVFDALVLSIFPIEKAKFWCEVESVETIQCAAHYYRVVSAITPNAALELCKSHSLATINCSAQAFKEFGVMAFEDALKYCKEESEATRKCTRQRWFQFDENRTLGEIIIQCRQ